MDWDLLEAEDVDALNSTEPDSNYEPDSNELTRRKYKDPRRAIEILRENKQLSEELFDYFN